ncbi:helix-turn-helix transcriptional regulator [Marispirochaeta sp.]|uniref:helix-turn-helix transcriptional regulator n=1 Tax=Marispirochaeta sp. TaxID=2038653 RepID=UPI0029C79E9E|nr:helix-turn-helix transcriptional regulator [Marispirochaeta sp.]
MTVTVDLIIQIIAISVGIGSLVVLTYLRFLVPPTTGQRYALVIVPAFTINYFFGILAYALAPVPVSPWRYTATVSVQSFSMLLLMFYSLRFVEVLGRPRYVAVGGAARTVLVVLAAAVFLDLIRPSDVTTGLAEVCVSLFTVTLWGYLFTVEAPSGIARGIRITGLLGFGILIPAFFLQRNLITESGFHVVDAVVYLFVTMSALIFSVYYMVHRRKEATELLSPAELQQRFDLTQREVEVMELLIKSYSYKEIGAALGIAMPTVKTHVTRVYKKTGTEGKSGLRYVILQNSGSVIQKST